MHKIKNIFNNHLLEFLFVPVFWLMIWGTYDADYTRLFIPGFPHNALDLFHGLRIFLPFFAIFLAIAILVKNKKKLPENFFLTPMGLLSIYAMVGIASSVFSLDLFWALYWAVLYGSAIIVLIAIMLSSEPARKLSLIININWVICGILSVALVIFFLIQPGVISSLTYNFLICSSRPYEGLAGVPRAPDTFGMAGTRPTGFGRYAGVAAIVAFVYLLYCKKENKRLKFIWFSLFSIFFLIIVFAKGRTAIVGFIVSIIFIVYFGKKINWRSVLGVTTIILILGFVALFNIPCSNNVSLGKFFASKIPARILPSAPVLSVTPNSQVAPVIEKPVQAAPSIPEEVITQRKLSTFSTLTGRTTGVWPDSWRLFLTNPLMGYGFQADRVFLDGQHAHNTLMQALVQTGLLGTIPLLMAFISSFIYLYKAIKIKDIEEKEKIFLMQVAGVFIFFAVRSITESTGAYFDADWLILAPLIAYIQYLNFRNLDTPNTSDQKYLSVNILDKKIDIMAMPQVLDKISYWIKEEPNKNHWIVVCGMHGVVEGYKNPKFNEIINSADLSLIDGMSLLFMGRIMGFTIKNRIAGPDLMKEYFKFAEKKGFTCFFLGDTEDTLKKLTDKALQDFPNLKIVGSYSPPFKDFSPEENKVMVEIINQKKPDVLWVAFSLKKQEEWIYNHRKQLNIPVVIGVGAVFKFLSGKVKRAPRWIGDMGFEWLWRLVHEPKIIWRRVFFDGPIFIWLVLNNILWNKK